MEKLTLKISEIFTLEMELSGFKKVNDKNEVIEKRKGFLEYKIPISLKYYLTKLNSFLKEQKDIIENLKMELFNKYGKIEGSVITILPENIEIFNKELLELFNQDCEIEYKPIDIETLDKIEEEENFEILYKLIKE